MKSAVVSRDVPAALPEFVRLVAHPVRWRLVQALAESDRAVWELTQLVDEPQSLVSYHLRRLRDGGLVLARRSSADGRDSYHALDLVRCQHELLAAGAALHPGLRLEPSRRCRRDGRAAGRVCCSSARETVHAPRSPQRSSNTFRGSDRNRERGEPPEAAASERGTSHEAARHRHQCEPHQALRRARRAAFRPRDHAVRQGPGSLSRVPRTHASCTGASRIPRSRARTNRASYPAFERTAAQLETRIRFLLPLLQQPPIRR